MRHRTACSESSSAVGTRPRAGFGGAESGSEYIAWSIRSVHTLRDYLDLLDTVDPDGVKNYRHGALVVVCTRSRVASGEQRQRMRR